MYTAQATTIITPGINKGAVYASGAEHHYCVCNFGLTYLVLGNYAFSFGFLGGIPDVRQHALCHSCLNPPAKWMKPLWRNHHLHHYKNEHKGFGVSGTLWDRLSVSGGIIDACKWFGFTSPTSIRVKAGRTSTLKGGIDPIIDECGRRLASCGFSAALIVARRFQPRSFGWIVPVRHCSWSSYFSTTSSPNNAKSYFTGSLASNVPQIGRF